MTRGHTVASGDRLGKTIIFAKNQNHAEFVRERFDANYPEYAGHFARVITHYDHYARTLIDDFSDPEKAPHIAVSVDMLDTGIDIPDVVNLVFFKLVHSHSKFWQMIGRGTRLRPDLYSPGDDKKDFLVFDFCGNLEYFNQTLPIADEHTAKPLSQRLFEARVSLLVALDAAHAYPEIRRTTAATLHTLVSGMNLDNVIVRPERRCVKHFTNVDAWKTLTIEGARDVIDRLAHLPSTVHDDDEAAKGFDLLLLRGQLAILDGDAGVADRVRQKVQALAEALLGATNIPAIKEHAALIEHISSDEWWVDATVPMLEHARVRLRGLIRFVDAPHRTPLYTDFRDSLGEADEISIIYSTTGTDWERFRDKARAYLRAHENNLALQRLRRNKQLTASDLDELELMLGEAALGSPGDLQRAKTEAGGLGVFIRQLVGLDRNAVTDAFAHYLDATRFTVDQIRFVTMIVDELTHAGIMEPGRIFDSPFRDEYPAPDELFDDADVEVFVHTIAEFTTRARGDSAA